MSDPDSQTRFFVTRFMLIIFPQMLLSMKNELKRQNVRNEIIIIVHCLSSHPVM